MEKKLTNKRIAILVANGFEESELTQPLQALEEAEAEVEVVSLEAGKVRAWSDGNWSSEYRVDKAITEVKARDYDALVLPGGVMSPDKLRMNKDVVEFVTTFLDEGKPVAAICHGPWTLIETGKLKGRTLTSYPSLSTDLKNSGAVWVDSEVIVDNGLVTSRKPDDLPEFCKKMIEEIAEGVHVTV
jgi:protease I